MDNNILGNNLPPTPSSENLNKPPGSAAKQTGYKNKLIAIGILVVVAVSVSVLAYNQSQQTSKPVNKTSILKTTNGVTVKYISSNLGFQTFSNGHYLSLGSTKTNDWRGEVIDKLYYDGQQVMDESELVNNGYLYREVLSHNGLHYAYVVGHTQGDLTNTNVQFDDRYDLYVDGKKVITIPHEIDWPAVTDDGQAYFYIRNDATSTASLTFVPHDLIKNDQVIFTNPIGFNSLQVSDDGTTFLALLEDRQIMPNTMEFLSLNGGSQMFPAPWGKVFGMLSPNGKHYGVIQNGALFIDGTAHLSNVNWDADTNLSITDSGHYVISSPSLGKIFIDDKEYDITPNKFMGVPILAAYINDDASHYLFYGEDGWILDGEPIDLKGAIPSRLYGGVELVGNTIYVYKSDLTATANGSANY